MAKMKAKAEPDMVEVAVVDKETGVVVTAMGITPPEGQTPEEAMRLPDTLELVRVPAGHDPVETGATWDGDTFTPPPEYEEWRPPDVEPALDVLAEPVTSPVDVAVKGADTVDPDAEPVPEPVVVTDEERAAAVDNAAALAAELGIDA